MFFTKSTIIKLKSRNKCASKKIKTASATKCTEG